MSTATVNRILEWWETALEIQERKNSMSLIHCFDAANPPEVAPAHCDAVLGYMGGADATRTWSLEQWVKFHNKRQFGAWVPDVTANPDEQAREAVRAARALGFHETRAIVFDLETHVDRAWWERVAFTVTNEKYLPVCYGSLSTVLGNAARYCWVAAWDGKPDLAPGQTIVAEQYAANVEFDGTQIDLSIVAEQLLHHAGFGPRHH